MVGETWNRASKTIAAERPRLRWWSIKDILPRR
jgi:hypothetical protein